MRKIIITSILCFFTTLCAGQVGINTALPLHPVHVDAKGNNPKDKIPTTTESEDDFVITNEGNVGIGVLYPTEKLSVKGGLKLIDGVDGTNKAITSDENGMVRKEYLPDLKPSVIGRFSGSNVVNTATTTGFIYINTSITLTRGKWIVNWGLTMDNKSSSDLWLESCLSTSQTSRVEVGFNFLGNPINKPSIGSSLAGKPSGQSSTDGNFDMIKGSNIIEVTSDSLVIYVLLKKDGNWSFGPGSWENYLYALPMK